MPCGWWRFPGGLDLMDQSRSYSTTLNESAWGSSRTWLQARTAAALVRVDGSRGIRLSPHSGSPAHA
ncbi:MAG: hypothetical protein QOG97_1486 [Acidimicrobiaceae bacterium]|nr:hypothetical protein [Acidimicrobiaceae bacterium]